MNTNFAYPFYWNRSGEVLILRDSLGSHESMSCELTHYCPMTTGQVRQTRVVDSTLRVYFPDTSSVHMESLLSIGLIESVIRSCSMFETESQTRTRPFGPHTFSFKRFSQLLKLVLIGIK